MDKNSHSRYYIANDENKILVFVTNMVQVLSKILTKNIADSCSQFMHPHTESCLYAGVQSWIYIFWANLHMYTYVHILDLLIKGRIPTRQNLKKTAIGIIFSAHAFTTLIAGLYCLHCIFGKFTNGFNILNIMIGPLIISSVVSIFQETKVRRPLLALYASQEFTHIIWNILKSRGLVKVIPHGTTILFSVCTSLLLWYLKAKIHVNKNAQGKERVDTIISFWRFIIGKNEEHDYLQHHYDEITDYSNNGCSDESSAGKPKKLPNKLLSVYRRFINRIKFSERHDVCPHSFSCLHYILEGSSKSFMIGTGIQTIMNLVFNFSKIIQNPKYLLQLFLHKQFLSIPFTLMGFTGIFRSVCCLLRWLTGKDNATHTLLAGLLAGLAYSQYNSTRTCLYVLWKTIAIFYQHGINTGYMPRVPYGSELQCSIVTAMVFMCMFLTPNNLRPGYFKTLHDISGGRFAAMYRDRLGEIGFDSVKELDLIMKKTRSQYGIKSFF